MGAMRKPVGGVSGGSAPERRAMANPAAHYPESIIAPSSPVEQPLPKDRAEQLAANQPRPQSSGHSRNTGKTALRGNRDAGHPGSPHPGLLPEAIRGRTAPLLPIRGIHFLAFRTIPAGPAASSRLPIRRGDTVAHGRLGVAGWGRKKEMREMKGKRKTNNGLRRRRRNSGAARPPGRGGTWR